MEYVEYINFYTQIRNQLDEYRMNDISEEVTLNNIHLYFFSELERYVFEDKTSLEILSSIMVQNDINIDLEDGQIKRTYSNYLKIREFLKNEEDKYCYDLLLLNIKNYFEDNEKMCKTSVLNFDALIEEALKHIREYTEIVLPCYDEYLSLAQTINLVKDFFKDIDKSGKLSIAFDEFFNDKNVFIWDRHNKERFDLLKKSKVAKINVGFDFMESFVSLIDDELFANIYFENSLLDAYYVIHEFIHYYIIKSTNFEEESECSKFFSEFPSIFFEYLFNLYLEKYELFEIDRNIQIEERKVENIKNVFMVSPARKLYMAIKNDVFIDLESFYNEYTESMEFKNFEDKASVVYRLLTEQIYDMDRFYDVLNVNLSELTYSDIISYISAVIFSEELISMVKGGKTYLIDRMFNVINSLAYTDMDPLYILSYLELNYRFYNFKSSGDNVVPKRLEKLR